jgi:hypothetical protein
MPRSGTSSDIPDEPVFWSDFVPRRVAPQTMKIEEEDEKEDEDDFLVR